MTYVSHIEYKIVAGELNCINICTHVIGAVGVSRRVRIVCVSYCFYVVIETALAPEGTGFTMLDVVAVPAADR